MDSTSTTTTAESGSQPTPSQLQFTGNGKEYFGIWIVNMLLTLVTLVFTQPGRRFGQNSISMVIPCLTGTGLIILQHPYRYSKAAYSLLACSLSTV